MRKVFCEVLGESLELPDRCERIVSLVPAFTEALFEAGVGDKISGVSTYCVRPSEARQKPTVGSYAKVKYPLLEKLNPDLILTTTGYQRNLAFELLRDKKLPVYAIALPPTLSAVISSCQEAVIVAGYPKRATELASRLLNSLTDIVHSQYCKQIRGMRVYLEIDLGGPVTFGSFSYITDAFRILGINTPYEEYPSEWIEPDYRHVCQFNPDVIIYEPKMFSRKNRTIQEVRKLLEERGLASTTALKHNRILITPGLHDFFAHPGPSFITVVLPWLVQNLSKFVH